MIGGSVLEHSTSLAGFCQVPLKKVYCSTMVDKEARRLMYHSTYVRIRFVFGDKPFLSVDHRSEKAFPWAMACSDR